MKRAFSSFLSLSADLLCRLQRKSERFNWSTSFCSQLTGTPKKNTSYFFFFSSSSCRRRPGVARCLGQDEVPAVESHLRHHGLLQALQGQSPLLGGGEEVRRRAEHGRLWEERGVADTARGPGPVSQDHSHAAPQVRLANVQHTMRLLGFSLT